MGESKLTGFPSAMTSSRPEGRARALAKVDRAESLFDEQSRKRRACSSATQSMELSSLSAGFLVGARAREDGREGTRRERERSLRITPQALLNTRRHAARKTYSHTTGSLMARNATRTSPIEKSRVP